MSNGERRPYEWDIDKAAKNLKRHRISFDEAATVFDDPLFLVISDPEHSAHERRYVMMGESNQNRLLVVVYTEQPDAIRLISARKATRRERREYEKAAKSSGR